MSTSAKKLDEAENMKLNIWRRLLESRPVGCTLSYSFPNKEELGAYVSDVIVDSEVQWGLEIAFSTNVGSSADHGPDYVSAVRIVLKGSHAKRRESAAIDCSDICTTV